jgi:hypothetical protein
VNVKLHLDDGVVEFSQGTVGPQTTRREFLHSKLGDGAEIFVDNEPFMTWRIRPEPGVTATLTFEGQRLHTVAWLFTLGADKENDWTEALELERKRIHDDWLVSALGQPPYRYDWGVVESAYDARGCASDIIVAYAR